MELNWLYPKLSTLAKLSDSCKVNNFSFITLIVTKKFALIKKLKRSLNTFSFEEAPRNESVENIFLENRANEYFWIFIFYIFKTLSLCMQIIQNKTKIL